ncbi:MAG TPA: alpha/beta fold hydrolase [Stellaceae bacterium]|jgi:homoserine O-acetyltransferase|nr:alpha/beta fold hydrolase [Stellaceae bacterium]
MPNASPLHTEDIGTVEDKFFTIHDFRLTNGETMPEATLVYETYGRLAPHGRNAMLVTHGYTGSHHAAGRNPTNNNLPGSWDGLIGPGKAIDTDKLFVVASNMLGSSFGSTNASSINPKTGQPYGSSFPHITVRDIVNAQKALLDSLGAKHLVAVGGPSYGGYQTFQWGVAYPDFMDGLVPVNTAPWASVNTDKQLAEVTARLATDPGWHGGNYYGKGGAKQMLTDIRIDTLKRYGIDEVLKPRFPDPVAREAAIREQAANWAAKWDANSLIILRRALLNFDTRPEFAKIKAKVFYMLCRTDALFPPKIAPDVMRALRDAGVEAQFFELDSELGHSSTGAEHAKWSPTLRAFMAPLVAKAA